MLPDFDTATTLAYKTLLEVTDRKGLCFPTRYYNFNDNGKPIIITSYDEYEKLTGQDIRRFTLDHKYADGITLRNLRSDLTLILINSRKCTARMYHTILHEIGHIKLNHKKHGDIEEIEAHHFASQFEMPNVVLVQLTLRGYPMDEKFLMKSFGVSKEAATKKIEYLNRYIFDHPNDYDYLILKTYEEYIDQTFPVIAPKYRYQQNGLLINTQENITYK